MDKKPKLLVLKGLPASGKSTYAKTLVKKGWVRTNKDEIRKEHFDGKYRRKDEKKVVEIRDDLIHDALGDDKNVVVDDTNLNPIHIKRLANIAKQYDATYKVDDSFMEVPMYECIERDANRENSVGEQVIRGMYHKWLNKPATALEYQPELPMAIVVDIDGTLAHMKGKRRPYDWHKVGQDEIDAGVAHLVDAVNCIDYATVFIFSGRDSVCKPETEEWLERHDIEYHLLAMRPEGNTEKDVEIKKRMLQEHVVDKYNVLFVVDDRPTVCRMWREYFGLRVFQVGDPHYEF